jgi:hypothetical protein
MERIESQLDIFRLSLKDSLLCFCLPGYSLWLFKLYNHALILVASYLLAFVVFIIRLGFVDGTMAYSLMISLHACSQAYVIQRLYADETFRHRIMRVFLVALSLLVFVYLPFQWLLLPRFFVPVRVHGKVVVVCTGVPAVTSVKRGDWVAYNIPPLSGPGYRVEGGLSFDLVRGVSGDKLVFKGKDMEINGNPEPRPDFLPATGEWIVPPGQWFIWPSLTRRGGHGVGVDLSILQELSLVSTNQYVGMAFKSWFGRKQVPL